MDGVPAHLQSEYETAAWLALARVHGLSAATLCGLLEQVPSVSALFDADSRRSVRLEPALDNRFRDTEWDRIEQDLEWMADSGVLLVTLNRPEYPLLLAEIADPPLMLYVRGNVSLLRMPQLAIVGSRNPTPQGLEIARDFARHLAHAGLGITSGLALGIDAASHRGALDVGGPTIAVAGTGLDRVYPASHRDLAHRIADVGALVSEFPPGTPPRKENFPAAIASSAACHWAHW